jgi:hypothetical protein
VVNRLTACNRCAGFCVAYAGIHVHSVFAVFWNGKLRTSGPNASDTVTEQTGRAVTRLAEGNSEHVRTEG